MTTRAYGMRPSSTSFVIEILKPNNNNNGKKQSNILLLSSSIKNRLLKARCCTSSSSSVMDPYKTLRIQRGASESEVKKAFRQLALQYHPDVCKGSNCGVQFHLINEAYDIVMSDFRGESKTSDMYESYVEVDNEQFRGMDDSDWELWEEWMGWEGASGIRDYSSHINPYI